MIERLKDIFGSRTKALEILYLLNDVKQVVRQGYYPNELEKVEKFCAENKLFVEKAPYKVAIIDDDKFSNKGKIVDVNHPKGMFFV